MARSPVQIAVLAACLLGQVLWSVLPFGAEACLRGLSNCGIPAGGELKACCAGCESTLDNPAECQEHVERCWPGCDCCVSATPIDQIAQATPRSAIDHVLTSNIVAVVCELPWPSTPAPAATGLRPHERPPPAACGTLRSIRMLI